MKRLLCLLRGHRWEEDADAYETYPVLRCRRCGKLRELAGREGRGVARGPLVP